MLNLYKTLFLSPDDVGMRGYKIEEIANRMKRSENVDQSSLIDFARTVQLFLDEDSPGSTFTQAK